MERTKYFNHTRPTATQLNFSENSRVNSIIRRFRASSQMGVAKGFIITVNAIDDTKIDIGPGEGYTGGYFEQNDVKGLLSGEIISTITSSGSGNDLLISSPTAQSVSLVDYTNGVLNYISLVYSETEGSPLAERYYPFTQHNTLVSESFTVEVLTEALWQTLSYTQLQNRILIGIITAKGAGVGLSASDITQTIQPNTHPVASNPTTIQGVRISGIYGSTLIGEGTLRLVGATRTLYWTSPGDSEGTGVQIGSSGSYTLYSNDTQYWIDIVVDVTKVPTSDLSNTITIRSLYGREIPLFSAVDSMHRDMVGTGTPTEANPHGLSLYDISDGTLDHADLFHRNGISSDADTTQLECAIYEVGPTDQVVVNNLGGHNNNFLIDGRMFDQLNGITPPTQGVLSFDTTPAPSTGDYLLYIDRDGDLQKVHIGQGASSNDYVFWDDVIQFVDMKNRMSGAGELYWNNVTCTLSWRSPYDISLGNPAGTPIAVLRLPDFTFSGYCKLRSYTEDDWVIVQLSGNLGASWLAPPYTVSNIELEESLVPEDEILKLGVVHWNAIAEDLDYLRDSRQFFTSDVSPSFLEEHNSDGTHTKVIQNTLQVGRGSNDYGFMVGASQYGICISCIDSYGIIIDAQDYAVSAHAQLTAAYCYGESGIGVYGTGFTGVYGAAPWGPAIQGSAVVYGVVGEAAALGVAGYASNTAIYATASSLSAIVGIARSHSGICGFAQSGDYGVYGSASGRYGLYGIAATSGIVGTAASYGLVGVATAIGIFGTASSTAILGYASANKGVCGFADGNTAIYGEAGGIYGVYGYAGSESGVFGTAVSSYGVFGKASKIGVYGLANTNGVYGSAVAENGVVGFASNTGVYGYASESCGVFATAASSYAVYAKANKTGIYATAATCGVSVLVNDSVGVYVLATNNTGVYAQAQATAMFGSALGNTAVFGKALSYGIFGSANVTGVCGRAGSLGVYGSATDSNGVYGKADVINGIYGEAPNYGIVGSVAGIYGVAGVAGAGIGVYGTAPDYGGYFEANTNGLAVSAGTTGVSVSAGSTALNIVGPNNMIFMSYSGSLSAPGVWASSSAIPVKLGADTFYIVAYKV
jgi:hypothetical protein